MPNKIKGTLCVICSLVMATGVIKTQTTHLVLWLIWPVLMFLVGALLVVAGDPGD